MGRIYGALRILVQFVQFGGRKGHPWACVTFGGVAVGVSHFVLVGAGRYGNCSVSTILTEINVFSDPP